MILLQISYESYIAIIATLMSVCAVFVTITPIVNNKWVKDLRKEICELKEKTNEQKREIDEIYNTFKRNIQDAKSQMDEVNRAIDEAKKNGFK